MRRAYCVLHIHGAQLTVPSISTLGLQKQSLSKNKRHIYRTCLFRQTRVRYITCTFVSASDFSYKFSRCSSRLYLRPALYAPWHFVACAETGNSPLHTSRGQRDPVTTGINSAVTPGPLCFPPTDHHLREPGGVPRRASARCRICNRRSCTHHPGAFPAIARDRPHRRPAASNSISSRATSRRNARGVPRRTGNCWRARITSQIWQSRDQGRRRLGRTWDREVRRRAWSGRA